jgi:hypothetical protein
LSEIRVKKSATSEWVVGEKQKRRPSTFNCAINAPGLTIRLGPQTMILTSVDKEIFDIFAPARFIMMDIESA